MINDLIGSDLLAVAPTETFQRWFIIVCIAWVCVRRLFTFQYEALLKGTLVSDIDWKFRAYSDKGDENRTGVGRKIGRDLLCLWCFVECKLHIDSWFRYEFEFVTLSL